MRTLSFCILFVLVGCTEEANTHYNAEDDRQAIRSQWDAFIKSWEAKDAQGCAAFYTENASHIPPNSNVNSGRGAIASFYETLFLDNAGSIYSHNIDALDIAGDQAVEQGNFQVTWTGLDSTNWSFEARSLTHWVRNEDQWMIQRLMFNLPKQ